MGEVVETILEERKGTIEGKGIEVAASDDLGRVVANPTHVYEVFANLIGNAIKHNENPSPTLTVSHLGDDGEGGHRYLVRDNGAGIPTEDMGKIFIPFFRGRKGETGIGLSIVEKTVKLYGGEIKVYNDEGACFEFVLRDFAGE